MAGRDNGERYLQLSFAVALAAEFADDAGMAPQVTAGTLIPANASVNRFVTDRESALELQTTADLLGTEPFAQEQLDQRPVLVAELTVSP